MANDHVNVDAYVVLVELRKKCSLVPQDECVYVTLQESQFFHDIVHRRAWSYAKSANNKNCINRPGYCIPGTASSALDAYVCWAKATMASKEDS